MKLYDNAASPYAFKVRATLYEKGLDFEKHEIRHHGQRAELLRVSPRGEVPALEDDGTVLFDSRIICDYLEEKHPSPPLLPTDRARRARTRALELVSDTQIDACLFVIGLVKIFKSGLEAEYPEVMTQALATLEKHYANLDAELAGKDHLVGAFSRADVAVAPHMAAAAFLGYPAGEKFPRLAAWVARINARPSIQRATAEAMTAFQESQTDADPMFTPERIHWRNDRIECAIRVGLGPWLLNEITAGRAFFSPVP